MLGGGVDGFAELAGAVALDEEGGVDRTVQPADGLGAGRDGKALQPLRQPGGVALALLLDLGRDELGCPIKLHAAQGLPELMENITESGSKSKTRGALEGVKEKVLGSDDDDGEQRSRRRRPQQSRSRKRDEDDE